MVASLLDEAVNSALEETATKDRGHSAGADADRVRSLEVSAVVRRRPGSGTESLDDGHALMAANGRAESALA